MTRKRIRHDDYPHLRFAFVPLWAMGGRVSTDPMYHIVDERMGDDYTLCRKPVQDIIRSTETEYESPVCSECWEKSGEGRP
jgi:hypothetical protein